MNQNLREDAMMEEAIASAEISMETPDTEGGEKESNLIEHNGNYYVRCETHEEVIRRLQEKHEEALSFRDTYWEERVGETRTALLFVGEKVLKEISEIYAVDIKYADKKQWLEPSEFERIFLHRFNEAGLKALDTVIEKIKNK